MSILPRKTCRVCGGGRLESVVYLGKQYVSDFVDDPISGGHLCPIELVRCDCCTLVQQKYTAPQDFLYSLHYWYRSGVTETMRHALADVTRAAERYLSPGDWVLDIGSNDGTLLRSYKKKNIVRIGVEPARNLAEQGRMGIDLLVEDFWSVGALYESLSAWKEAPAKTPTGFKVITACGMFYDLEDPNAFIADVAKVLLPDGVFIAQLMCLKQTLELLDVGNLSHEHLEFYTLRSLDTLFGRHGLRIFDIQENKVNGGSYRLFVTQSDGPILPSKAQVNHKALFYGTEEPLQDDYRQVFSQFNSDIARSRDQCYTFIDNAVKAGGKVWVYGASTKGNVILQYYGLGPSHISGAADRSFEKIGKYTIGTNIKIYSEEEARRANPDYFLVLPYAFLDEFYIREEAWRNRGGKFLVPIPEFRVVE